MTTRFEELAKEQKEIGDEIGRMLKNYEGAPPERKTKEYLEKRLGNLEVNWADFRANHALMEEKKTENSKHSYFVKDFPRQVEELVSKLMEDMEDKLRAFENKDDPKKVQGININPTVTAPKAALITQNAKRIKLQRSTARTLVRIIGNITAEYEQQQSKVYFNEKIQLLSSYWKTIASNHMEIICDATEVDEEDDYIKNNYYDELEDRYQQILIALKARYETFNHTGDSRQAENAQPQEIKLPPVHIPRFDGDYYTWKSFQDLFIQLIHHNNNLGKAQKMHYLKANLSGSAGKLLQHLQVTDSNYDTAWELLNKRYENKRLLVATHIQKLLMQQPLQQESGSGLKRLHDTSKECLLAIQNLRVETKDWDPLIVHILTLKLDKDSHKQYEERLKNPKELQNLDDFFLFLEDRFQALEAIGDRPKKDTMQTKWSGSTNLTKTQKPVNQHLQYSINSIRATKSCTVCKDKNHTIHACTKFLNMLISQRRELVKQNNLCTNCLQGEHKALDCRSNKTCKICRKKHNTLLHIEATVPEKQHVGTSSTNTVSKEEKLTSNSETLPCKWQSPSWNMQSYIANERSKRNLVMLATALVQIKAENGTSKVMRALIDQGSQTTLITENAAQQLRTRREKVLVNITGVGNTKAETARSRVHFTISPRFSTNFQLPVTALVLTKLTKTIPGEQLPIKHWSHIQDLTLADPNFHEPGAIDIILGADYLAEILLQGLINGRPGTPTAQNTKLGWILFGSISWNNVTCCTLQSDIDSQIKQFWEMEEVPKKKVLTDIEKECEEHFEKNVHRSKNGRYTVRIPFDSQKNQNLGASKPKAFARLMQMEKKFATNNTLRKEYKKFMEEYLSLGHMKLAEPVDEREVSKLYYLPHQAVVNENSTTTKLRVVFDASAKTSTGISLNDRLLNGPVIQQDIASILMRWRKHRIGVCADIEKMYRQIEIAKEDQNYHRILWRSEANQPVKEYNLTTVTYGTRPASYLATKTLQKLAMDEGGKYPKAKDIILKDFYVDDLLSGCDTEKEAKEIQVQVTSLLAKGGFPLRKWASNSIKLMDTIPEHLRSMAPIQIDTETTIKTLGIHWSPKTDIFEIKVKLPTPTRPHTKRSLLSDISKLYDPLGWMAPAIMSAKIMFQDLWLTGMSWDQELPESIASKWEVFREELPQVEKVKIPRWMQYSKKRRPELIGFCDASEKAYAAVVYSKVTTEDGEVKTTLIAAKTKVAPISKRVSLPRLELCGAVLLSNLMKQIKSAMELEDVKCHAYTDSTIVLAWIRGHPSKWKTFVANRVAEIHSTSTSTQWHHVSSTENPADAASRGITPSQLVRNKLWWTGPKWLKEEVAEEYKEVSTELEVRKICITTATIEENELAVHLLKQYSTFSKLNRVIAFCHRFIHNAKKNKEEREKGPLKPYELKQAKFTAIKLTQALEFQQELTDLGKGRTLSLKSKLLSLNPMLDEMGIIRVGGRLHNAELSHETKHPIILPYKSPLTTLAIDMAHKRTMHGGINLTHAYLRNEFWIIKGDSAVKQFIHKCIICRRFSTTAGQQLMGNLPKPRVTITKPFTNSGVDYAGPIDIRMTKGRGIKSHKGYIVVFVCLCTKAIHLEVASDLTAEAFIAAFKRFIARRGHVADLYSDNGTNFVLANKILRIDSEDHHRRYLNSIQDELSNLGTQWHFIPPSSPHFGGLWEAGVKAVKFHLKRVIKDTKLTFEEMSTVLAQIEACLNSRPLCPLREDPSDTNILTPGHFLIGAPLLAPPAKNLLDKNLHSLKRWQLLERMHQDFWKKWSEEYLTRLQKRPKWHITESNFKPGDLVLIKGEQLPPTKWPLGRILETHPGNDGLVRVATIKTRTGTLKRPITKLCFLPVTEIEESRAALPEEPHPIVEEVNPTKSTESDVRSSNPKVHDYAALMCKFLKEAKKNATASQPQKN